MKLLPLVNIGAKYDGYCSLRGSCARTKVVVWLTEKILFDKVVWPAKMRRSFSCRVLPVIANAQRGRTALLSMDTSHHGGRFLGSFAMCLV